MNLKQVGYIFSIAIAFLGISAASLAHGKRPARRAMFCAAICFGLGFVVASFRPAAIALAHLSGDGVIGGMGLGLGYLPSRL